MATTFHVVYGSTSASGNSSPYFDLPVQGSAVPISTELTGLSPSTTYHYQLIATNTAGESASADMTFMTTAAQSPSVTVTGVTYITSTNAFIGGTVNPNGLPTGYYVQWGTNTSYGMEGSGGSLAAQSSPVTVIGAMLGLSPSTTYHCRLVATNAEGCGYSGDLTLTTSEAPPPPPPIPPTVATGQASQITGTSANLTGTVNPNGLTGSYYFRWDTTTAYGNVTPTVWPVDGSTPSTAAASLTGLSPGVTYHFQLVATNSAGSAAGADESFSTLNAITIGGNTFTYMVTNGTVTIGSGVQSIGAQAFQDCASLTRATIPDSVVELQQGALSWGGPQGAFYGCDGLTNVIVGKGLTGLGAGSFGFCGNLTAIYFIGNAPFVGDVWGAGPFYYTTSAVVYYMPGTTGWGSTYAGRPALLWNLQPLTTDGSFGVGQNGFGFNIKGTASILVVKAATDPAAQTWIPLQNCTLTNGSVYFSDAEWKNHPGRFTGSGRLELSLRNTRSHMGVNVQRFRDSRIIENWGGSNSLEALVELGVVRWASDLGAVSPTRR